MSHAEGHTRWAAVAEEDRRQLAYSEKVTQMLAHVSERVGEHRQQCLRSAFVMACGLLPVENERAQQRVAELFEREWAEASREDASLVAFVATRLIDELVKGQRRLERVVEAFGKAAGRSPTLFPYGKGRLY